jgi:hypothetical protein
MAGSQMKNKTIVFSKNRDLVVAYGKKLLKRNADILEGPAGPVGNHVNYYYVIYASGRTACKEVTFDGLVAKRLPEELADALVSGQERFDILIRFLNGEKVKDLAASLNCKPQEINELVFPIQLAIYDTLKDTKYWRGLITDDGRRYGLQPMKTNKVWWFLYLKIIFKYLKEKFEKAYCERTTRRLKTSDSWDPKVYIKAHKAVEPINYTIPE